MNRLLTMGQTQSKKKGKLLYEEVSSGNVERIRALRLEGADLEWMDKEGKTPLILACTKQDLCDVARALIQLGANVNAHRLASARHAATFVHHAGTPLYHAATRGLEDTVKLLLSNGATYDWQRPLEVARSRGFTYVVRAIENHFCFFSGSMREFYSLNIFGFDVPQLRPRTVWAVIVPTRSTNPFYKFELIVYASKQDAKPRMVMAVPDLTVKEPVAMHPDASVTINDNSTRTTKSITLAASVEEGRQQLKWFCDACKGIRQPVHPPVPSAPPLIEDDTAAVGGANTEDGGYGQCMICVVDPCNAICLPCSHIAGCEPCLTEIRSRNQGCPFCRAESGEVRRVYRTVPER